MDKEFCETVRRGSSLTLRILIKTYCFESGLWYLAKAIGDNLTREGHEVFYITKAKYALQGKVFKRTYPEPENKNDFIREPIIRFSEKRDIHRQISKTVLNHKINTIISFETLMEKSSWILKVKKDFPNIKICDVPMLEWVTPRLFNSGAYKIFDEIWALTDQTEKAFKKHNVVRKRFDIVDRSLFYKETKDNDDIIFFHMGSLNPFHSVKNTELVVEAFEAFLDKEKPNAKLIFTAPKDDFNYENHTNILHISNVLKRHEIGKMYRDAHVVLAPSSREGLGMSLYEAEACGCKIITTDAAPMNESNAEYLCLPKFFKKSRGLVPFAEIEKQEIQRNIEKVYKDIKNGRR